MRTRRIPRTIALALPLSLALAACSGGDDQSDPGGAPADGVPEIVQLVPEDVQERGSVRIHVQHNAGLPFGIDEDGEILGLSADLGELLADAMGLEADIIGAEFAAMIPGLQSGRYDLSAAVVTDTTERREQITIIDYMYGTGFNLIVQAGNGPLTIEESCGLTIAVNVGSVQEIAATEASEACVAAGEPAITVNSFSSNPDAILAVKSGRADGFLAGTGLIQYATANDDSIELAGTTEERVSLLGIAVPLDSELEPAARAALLHLYETGALEELLDDYGLADLLVETSEVISTPEPDPAQYLAR